jgi:hypothetical protein
LKKIPRTVIFIIIVFAGGIGITFGFEIIFDTFDIPHNQNFAENRIKRFTEPLNWIEDRVTDSP